MIGEIASHLPRKMVFKLQSVSEKLSHHEAVQKARVEFADGIAAKAIKAALKEGKPFSPIKMTEKTRHSVKAPEVS